MSLDSKIRLIAGTFILLSVLLGVLWSPWAFAFTVFVGLNLMQSAVTKWCLMEDILRRTGAHKG
jgi:Inner membrane protein YgaP-like, transmembrane domain